MEDISSNLKLSDLYKAGDILYVNKPRSKVCDEDIIKLIDFFKVKGLCFNNSKKIITKEDVYVH